MADESKDTKKSEDSKRVNVVLIAHKQSQFSAAASFLTRRGIPCTVRGNIKDGIQFITQHKATHVFLSWNLPNANIFKTYQLLTKTLKVECIVYAEKPDGKTAAELANSRLPETMQAPVSGPGLYMRIQKMMKAKDEEGKAARYAEKAQREMSDQDASDDKIVLKSSKTSAENDRYMRFASDKKDSGKPGMVNFQSPKYSEEDYQEVSTSDPHSNDISEYLDQIGYDESKEQSAELGSNDVSNLEAALDPNDVNELNAKFREATGEERRSKRKAKEQDYGQVMNIAKNNERKSSDLPEYEQTKPKEALLINSEENSAKEALIVDFKPRVESRVANSILETSVLEAINKSVRPARTNFSAVHEISKAKIINIHTQRFRGYLITIVPMNRKLDHDVFSDIKKHIKRLLEKEGESLLDFEELDVDLEENDFLSWAKENTEFLIQTVDNQTEIICAYYPIVPSLPEINESNSKMAAIQSKDLVPESKTRCNLFLHLPKNNKYVCYLKRGDTITQHHANKFDKHKVENLHIKKEEIRSFKEYFASSQIKNALNKKKKAA